MAAAIRHAARRISVQRAVEPPRLVNTGPVNPKPHGLTADQKKDAAIRMALIDNKTEELYNLVAGFNAKYTVKGSPMEIYVDDEAKLTLHGLVQHYIKLTEAEKNRKLNDILDALDFNQVVIFVKSVSRAAELNKLLCKCNFPAISILSGMTQEERLTRYKNFKEGHKRILVATDLVGRGIDIERVNIVINYDMPDSADTYLHRVGRAGRFGTKGLAITFVSSASDSDVLNQVQERFEVDIKELPEQIDTSTYMPS
ncbi:hypothetical protein ACQ4PT_039294 [Festuca glaucescens]